MALINLALTHMMCFSSTLNSIELILKTTKFLVFLSLIFFLNVGENADMLTGGADCKVH